MSNIKVSIVMPVLNGMPFFEEALESVCSQSLKEIEVIVVDGGSTDGTREYVASKMESDERVRLLDSDMRSMGRQYNLGIQNSSGEYIGFCESDDLIKENMLLDLYKYLSENEDVDFVKSDFEMFIGKDESMFSVPYNILPNSKKSLYNKKICLNDYPDIIYRDVNMWNGLYRKSFIIQSNIVLNETKGAAFQDTDFIQQALLAAKKILYVNIPSYMYRRDNDASSVFKDTANFVAHELEYMLDILYKNKILDDKKIEIITNRLFYFYCDRLGRSLFLKLTDAEDEQNNKELDILKDKYSTVLDRISIPTATIIKSNVLFDAFMNSRELFFSLCENLFRLRREYLEAFGNMVRSKKAVYIFGAGELGIATLALLMNNNCNSQVEFMDNNSNMWGKTVCGALVVSPEECKNHLDSLYILPRNAYCSEIEQQLMQYGVKPENIFIQPELGIHSSLEYKY